VEMLPDLIKNIEDTNSVSVICVDLNFCATPFTPKKDGQTPP